MSFPKTIKIGALLGLTAIVFLLVGYKLANWQNQNVPAKQEKESVNSKESPVETPLDKEIVIQDQFIESSGIKVSKADVGQVTNEILAPALVSTPPGAEATVIARVAGTIKQIYKRLGDTVKAGETVALVDSLEATRMTAERKSAIAKLELAKKVYARESMLFEKGVTPRQDLEAAQSALTVAEAEASETQSLARATNIAPDGHSILVVSPVDGKITAETATVGAFVQPATPLFSIANDKEIQINAFITAQDFSKVKVGDSATVLSRNDQEFSAKVRSITPSVNGSNQTATAILTLEDKNTFLVIGEGVQVRLHTVPANQSHMIVPEDAIQNIEGRDVVFIKTKAGFKPHPVIVGQRGNGYAQILSGLDRNLLVATKNAFLIKAEMIKNAPEED